MRENNKWLQSQELGFIDNTIELLVYSRTKWITLTVIE